MSTVPIPSFVLLGRKVLAPLVLSELRLTPLFFHWNTLYIKHFMKIETSTKSLIYIIFLQKNVFTIIVYHKYFKR